MNVDRMRIGLYVGLSRISFDFMLATLSIEWLPRNRADRILKRFISMSNKVAWVSFDNCQSFNESEC